ncbi:TetR/AcrR family transcriptional regulator [Caulobacter vibrioides]|uniref:TetR/AcrR family transcriptional regulator n=1 Tax=Caulobacter vibrioides TaxID=155892 RepID=UPI000BB4B854|nr:TetR/AcrR family transcriptional regulator [Caulobacter vibrioides]ATC26782.1 TetR/AcrR family transcriptional regulator [Caulobacter vibrioides]AZH13575.1 TetR/AcrR family transcriptional regulator [Caulobacter vibrioides]PLR14571.1 TetR/AcrR family transcriptional regulator [Caulobacter vibrioides]
MTSSLKVPERRTQSDRRQQSEAELLRAAAELIAEQGVAAATFENIGARAGYSRGLATQRFGSKHGLIEALIARLQARLQAQMDDRRLDQMNGLEAVLGFVDAFLTTLSQDGELRAYFVMMAGAVGDMSDLRAPFAAAHKEAEQRLEAMVLRGQAESVIRPDLDADAAALMVGSLLLGVSTQLLIDPGMDLEPIRRTSLVTLRVSFGGKTEALSL